MTVWTELLAREGYTLSASAAELGSAALADADCFIAPLPQLGLLQAEGTDAATYLHNLVSNEVEQLTADGLVWNSLNTPKGRMIANFLLWPESPAPGPDADSPALFRLLASADLLAALHKRLSMYILRSKVRVDAADKAQVVFALCGTQAAQLLVAAALPLPATDMSQAGDSALRVLRLAADHFIIVATPAAAASGFAALLAAGAAKAGSARWQLALIRAGLALISQPTQEEFVAQMINFELTGGVNFKKGCYPGQEIVARAQYLGKVKRRMYRLASLEALATATLPAPGSEVFAGAPGDTPEASPQAVGKLVNVAPNASGGFEALAVLHSSSIEEQAALRLGSATGPRLQVLPLPYPLP